MSTSRRYIAKVIAAQERKRFDGSLDFLNVSMRAPTTMTPNRAEPLKIKSASLILVAAKTLSHAERRVESSLSEYQNALACAGRAKELLDRAVFGVTPGVTPGTANKPLPRRRAAKKKGRKR